MMKMMMRLARQRRGERRRTKCWKREEKPHRQSDCWCRRWGEKKTSTKRLYLAGAVTASAVGVKSMARKWKGKRVTRIYRCEKKKDFAYCCCHCCSCCGCCRRCWSPYCRRCRGPSPPFAPRLSRAKAGEAERRENSSADRDTGVDFVDVDDAAVVAEGKDECWTEEKGPLVDCC